MKRETLINIGLVVVGLIIAFAVAYAFIHGLKLYK